MLFIINNFLRHELSLAPKIFWLKERSILGIYLIITILLRNTLALRFRFSTDYRATMPQLG